jgi:ribosomal protein S18 acetylase RimI-like enzyme
VTSTLNPQFDPALLSRIEDAGLNASAPPQQLWLDGWVVRFSPGKAKRARCVNAVAIGRLSVAARLEACARIYADAELPLIVRITPFSLPTELDATLAGQGLHRFDDTRVMVLAGELGDAHLPAAPTPPAAVTIHSLGLDMFAQRVAGFRGSPLAQRQAHSNRLLNSPVPFFAFELRVAGEPMACGQYALEGDICGLYDVFTAGASRGRGLAQMLCRHLLLDASRRGARHAYLQVEGDNLAARSVYHRLGFVDAYGYHYRARDPAAA